jgi:hypothetical protein
MHNPIVIRIKSKMSDSNPLTKNQLYEQVARIGKAIASPKRLERIKILCQGEKTVE